MTLPDETRSLRGRRILVTRAVHQAGKLSEGLRELGVESVEVPVLEIRPPESFAPLDAALHKIANYDWLIFTSANTVRAVVERVAGSSNLLFSASARIAAVGEATAEALRTAGLPVDFVPKNYVAESLVAGLAGGQSLNWSGKRVLLARASTARDVIPDALRAAGAEVDVVDAYRNVLPAEAPERLCEALAQQIDAAIFTSSSSVTHLAEAAARAGIAFPFTAVLAVSIGPVTSATLCEHGWEPAAEADSHDIPGLIAAVADLLTRA